MYYDTNKAMMTNECTLSVGHFDGQGSAPEQFRRHCLMRHVQGYSGSHWTLPLGNYSLCITPAAARATQMKRQQKYVPKRLAILMAVAVRRYNTAHIAQ
jgi:hypothetical protein